MNSRNQNVNLKYIAYAKGYKYQLHEYSSTHLKYNPHVEIETDYISLNKHGYLFIRKGYAWDGPSGPTYDSKNSMRASLVHDALYQLMRMGFLPSTARVEADKELYHICREDGMSYFRAKVWYIGVRTGAASAAKPKNKKKILIAP